MSGVARQDTQVVPTTQVIVKGGLLENRSNFVERLLPILLHGNPPNKSFTRRRVYLSEQHSERRAFTRPVVAEEAEDFALANFQ